MRRVTTLALITGGIMAAVTAGVFARGRPGGRGPEAPTSSGEDLQYTLFALGGGAAREARGALAAFEQLGARLDIEAATRFLDHLARPAT